jgi:hypothetical protein
MGEMLVFKQDDLAANTWLQVQNAIHVVDRAFVDGRYWDQRYQRYRSTVITRMKSIITYTDVEDRPIAPNVSNHGVLFGYSGPIYRRLPSNAGDSRKTAFCKKTA